MSELTPHVTTWNLPALACQGADEDTPRGVMMPRGGHIQVRKARRPNR